MFAGGWWVDWGCGGDGPDGTAGAAADAVVFAVGHLAVFFFGGTYLLEGFCYEVHRDEWTFIASRRVRLHTEVWFSNWLNQTCQNMTVGDIRYGQSTHVTEGLRTTFRRHQS